MLDAAFHQNHNYVEYQPAPPAVAVAVDNHQSAVRPKDAMHLRDDLPLIWVMMKAVRTGDEIKGVIGKGKSFAIPPDQVHAILAWRKTVSACMQHVAAQVEADHFHLRKSL